LGRHCTLAEQVDWQPVAAVTTTIMDIGCGVGSGSYRDIRGALTSVMAPFNTDQLYIAPTPASATEAVRTDRLFDG